MTYWEKYISEEMTAAQKKKAAEKVMDDLTGKKKKKKGKGDKSGSEYTEYLKQQLDYKRKKYEDQKKREIEKRKEKAQKETEGKAKQALSSIKQQTISYKDQDPTAYRKAVENIGSAAAGIGKAAYYALQARKKKKQAEKEQSKQPEKKEPGKPGRPKAAGGDVQTAKVADVTPKKKETALSGTPERKKLVPSTKRLAPASKKLGPAGGAPYQAPSAPSRETGMSLGQRARRNPALKSALIKSRMEEYSNWKEEFIFEVDDKMNKVEKKKVIDIMKGKNKIEVNPTVMEDHKEISSGKKQDDEGYMANVELDQMERAIKALRKKVKKADAQLPAWVQSKITRAADYIDTASEYMQSDEKLSEEIDKKKLLVMLMLKAADNAKRRKNSQLNNGIIGEDNINEIAPLLAAVGRAALGTAAKQGAKTAIASTVKDIAKERIKRGVRSSLERAGQRIQSSGTTGSGISPSEGGASAYMKALTNIVGEEVEISEAKKSEMKCNKPRAEAHGSGETGKSHVVKACEGGKEKLIRFGQLGVKGSPKKEGESEEYASRRHRFQIRHAKNIAKGKMSAAYWANKVKW